VLNYVRRGHRGTAKYVPRLQDGAVWRVLRTTERKEIVEEYNLEAGENDRLHEGRNATRSTRSHFGVSKHPIASEVPSQTNL
jgi:hypothetical protein